MQWPYANEAGTLAEESCDVLVLGGGLAGRMLVLRRLRDGMSPAGGDYPAAPADESACICS